MPILDRFLLHHPLMLRYGPSVPMLRFTLNRLKERASWIASGHATKRDFLQRCIEAQAKYPDVVTERMIVLYNFNNIGAGSDTTAIALTSVRRRWISLIPRCIRVPSSLTSSRSRFSTTFSKLQQL